MLKNSLKFLFLFLPAVCAAQDSSSLIPKKSYAQILNQYVFKQPVQNGIFDSTDSWFSVFQDTFFQSPFDSICLRNNGKTWHRNEVMDCRSYLVINDLHPYSYVLGEDTAEWDTAVVNRIERLKKMKKQLWVCEGEFFMNEDANATYSGRFTGTFHIYFLFDRLKKSIFVCTNNTLPPEEPAVFFYGYWQSLVHKEWRHIPYFWASNPYELTEDSNYVLPDLRIQPDGSQSFSHTAEFSKNCTKPSKDWYKEGFISPVIPPKTKP